MEAAHVLSRLWIGGASGSDSGNYTCSVPALVQMAAEEGEEGAGAEDLFPRARVKVHVVDGKSNRLRIDSFFVNYILCIRSKNICCRKLT